jgi:hypothetical protein
VKPTLPAVVAVRYEERDGRSFKVKVLADSPPAENGKQAATPEAEEKAPRLAEVLAAVVPGRVARLPTASSRST